MKIVIKSTLSIFPTGNSNFCEKLHYNSGGPAHEEEVVNTTTNLKDMNAHMTIDNDYVSNSNGFSSPVKEAELEVNYENNVTALYDAISNSQWNKALGTLQHSPLEARTWVVRYKEDNTKGVMWRFLPLHSACARQPPNAVISALLQAYPGGAGSCDDQGMVSSKERCLVASSS